MNKLERIAKRIAHSGKFSRREAERLLAQNRVAIENPAQIITDPATKIASQTKIFINGKLLHFPKPEIYLYYKAEGLLTSHSDPHHLSHELVTVDFNEDQKKLKIIGRLDKNTEGLLLLTNHGELQHYLESPASHISRTYHVRVYGAIPKDLVAKLQVGLTIEGVHYRPIEASIIMEGRNSWIELTLHEGKNREIRNIMQFFNLRISRLKRISYGPFILGNLRKHLVKKAPMIETKKLLEQFYAHH